MYGDWKLLPPYSIHLRHLFIASDHEALLHVIAGPHEALRWSMAEPLRCAGLWQGLFAYKGALEHLDKAGTTAIAITRSSHRLAFILLSTASLAACVNANLSIL